MRRGVVSFGGVPLLPLSLCPPLALFRPPVLRDGCRCGVRVVSVVFFYPPCCVAVLCVPWCRGLWRCSLSGVRPSLFCFLLSRFGVTLCRLHPSLPFVSRFTRCIWQRSRVSASYSFLYSVRLGLPPWRAFLSASLVSLCVAVFFHLVYSQSPRSLSRRPVGANMAVRRYCRCWSGMAGMWNAWCATRL